MKVTVRHTLSGPDFDRVGGPAVIEMADGRLAVSPADPQAGERLAMPAPVNAHDHGYGIPTLACGAPDDALECWIPGLANRPDTDPELEARVAFARMALSGIGTTVHCHNSLRRDRLADEACAVRRAADAVGIRVAFSCPVADRNPHVYGDPAPLAGYGYPPELLQPAAGPTGAEQVAAALAIRADLQSEMFNVQLGPIGPQWCAPETLEAVASASADHDMRVHMHLLETERQRQWLDRTWPEGPVRRLDALGLLSPRLTVAHGVWLRPEECALLAERGVTVAVNTSSNLRLRSGIAPVARFAAAGLGFALGLDGGAFDDDQDIFREWRLFRRLQSGMGLDDGMPPARLLRAAFTDGFRVFDGRTDYGAIRTGAPADVAVLDLESIVCDRLGEETPLLELVLARLGRAAVGHLFVAGRHVVADGRLTGFDAEAAFADLVAQARSAKARADGPGAAIASGREAIRRYYRDGCHLR